MPDPLLLVSIGNTRTRFAPVRDGQLEPSRVEPNGDVAALVGALLAVSPEAEPADEPGEHAPVLIASVNPPVADAVSRALREQGRRIARFGSGPGDLPILIDHTLDDASTVGADRLLDALGAYSRAQAACVVVDAGTAITVDFVDGEGTFHGGAIGPGVRMMCEALHEKAASLPLVHVGVEPIPGDTPGEPPFGRSTRPAIALGVVSAARGMVRLLIDKYAEYYEAYPRVIATGGDAAMLFENDPLVEHVLPDLTLMGMLEAYHRLEALDEADGTETAGSDPERER